MRVVVCLALLVAATFAQYDDEPEFSVEENEHIYEEQEEEIIIRKPRSLNYNENWYEESYDEKPRPVRFVATYNEPENKDVEEPVYRQRRNVDEGPYDEHVRVKRRCDLCEKELSYRPRHLPSRNPRQVHQYEVHEFTDDFAPAAVPYEQMLAASADHYHKVFPSPGAPKPARYSNPAVSALNLPQAVLSPPIPNVSFTPNGYIKPEKYKNPPSFVPSAVFDFVKVPVSGPVPAIPVPVSSEPLPAPLRQLASEDQASAGAHHQHKSHHSHDHKEGGGHKHHAEHHNKHGDKTSKGSESHHHLDKGGKGFKKDENHKKEYEEVEGKKKKHHDHADHKGEHEEEAHGHRGSKFAEKKGHKKGHKTKGYHNKYHKDEYHKEHKFYDDFHKSGEHHRFGKFNAKHASNEGGKKKAHHVNAGHDKVEKGKKGHSEKGHVDSDHKGHNAKHGHEEHHEHEEHHAKKGGKEGGKHWGYQHKQ